MRTFWNWLAPTAVTGWVVTIAWLNLVGNLIIIGTGGAVRLTGSGLGCPTWPQCTDTSFVPTAEQGLHGLIEFANRLMSPVLGILAVLALIAVWRIRASRRDLWVHAWIVIGGILVQGVLGGIIVLTRLQMSTVGIHYAISAALVAVSASFVIRASRPAGPRVRSVPGWMAGLTYVAALLLVLVVGGGIVTTQNGPHSGDADVIRDSSAWDTYVHIHSFLSYALVVVLLVLLAGSAILRARPYLMRLVILILVIGAQIVVGITQAQLGIPPLLVGIHMVIAGIATAVMVALVYALKRPVHAQLD